MAIFNISVLVFAVFCNFSYMLCLPSDFKLSEFNIVKRNTNNAKQCCKFLFRTKTSQCRLKITHTAKLLSTNMKQNRPHKRVWLCCLLCWLVLLVFGPYHFVPLYGFIFLSNSIKSVFVVIYNNKRNTFPIFFF